MSKQHRAERPPRDPLLIEVLGVRGTASRIAAACGIHREAVWNWRRVPSQHVIAVAGVLKLSRCRIRPDLYPPPARPAAKEGDNNGRKLDGANA